MKIAGAFIFVKAMLLAGLFHLTIPATSQDSSIEQ